MALALETLGHAAADRKPIATARQAEMAEFTGDVNPGSELHVLDQQAIGKREQRCGVWQRQVGVQRAQNPARGEGLGGCGREGGETAPRSGSGRSAYSVPRIRPGARDWADAGGRTAGNGSSG